MSQSPKKKKSPDGTTVNAKESALAQFKESFPERFRARTTHDAAAVCREHLGAVCEQSSARAGPSLDVRALLDCSLRFLRRLLFSDQSLAVVSHWFCTSQAQVL